MKFGSYRRKILVLMKVTLANQKRTRMKIMYRKFLMYWTLKAQVIPKWRMWEFIIARTWQRRSITRSWKQQRNPQRGRDCGRGRGLLERDRGIATKARGDDEHDTLLGKDGTVWIKTQPAQGRRREQDIVRQADGITAVLKCTFHDLICALMNSRLRIEVVAVYLPKRLIMFFIINFTHITTVFIPKTCFKPNYKKFCIYNMRIHWGPFGPHSVKLGCEIC